MYEAPGKRILWGMVCSAVFVGATFAQDTTNVAPNGVATQSSTFLDGFFGGEAETAIDRVTAGDNGQRQVTHTDNDDTDPDGTPIPAWWEIALDREYEIEKIVLWNRTDCCAERLTNFLVQVRNTAGIETFGAELFPDGTDFPETTETGFEINVGARGSVVRVELLQTHAGFNPDEYFLTLAEVEVLAAVAGIPIVSRQPEGGRVAVGGSFTFSIDAGGTEPLQFQWEHDEVAIDGATQSALTLTNIQPSDQGEYSVRVTNPAGSATSEFAFLDVTGPNLALCGTATQSSSFFAAAALAIDGDNRGESSLVSHTNLGDVQPWWEVRLAAEAEIDSLILWNRTDCCGERLSNITVSILSRSREELWSEDFFTDGTFAGEQFEIPDVGVTGQVVRIEKGTDDLTGGGLFLSLAEVEVFGDAICSDPPPLPACPLAGDTDFADTSCDTLTAVGPPGGSQGNYLVTATSTDTSGDVVQYTFTASLQGSDAEPLVRGPQEVEWAYFPLTFGKWDIAVSVDDRGDCDDAGASPVCTSVVDVVDAACVPGDVCNVAIRGTATQSSTFFFGADVAIDGVTEGDNSQEQVTHTGFNDNFPTWELELDQNYEIERIALWNRTDCCGERLTNFRLTIFDEGRDIVFEEIFFPEGTAFPETSVEGYEIPIDGVVGRFVEIQLQNDHPTFNAGQHFLSLAEVQVFAPTSIEAPAFRRGDANGDGAADLSDGVFVLNNLFLGGSAPTCAKTADADDTGDLDLSDPVFLFNHLFLGGPVPPAPFGVCGQDPTADELTCESFASCL